jgi:hypothetical protein
VATMTARFAAALHNPPHTYQSTNRCVLRRETPHGRPRRRRRPPGSADGAILPDLGLPGK